MCIITYDFYKKNKVFNSLDANSSFCMCCLQISVEAPWLSNIQGRCTVIGKAMLTCVDAPTVSLYMLDLHADTEMTQIHLQVTKVNSKFSFCKIVTCILCFSLGMSQFIFFLTLEVFFFANTLLAFYTECFPFSSSSHWDLRSPLASIQFWSPPSPTQHDSHCLSSSCSLDPRTLCSSSSTVQGR